MNTFFMKIAGISLLFLFTFLTGFLVSRSGKPYGVLLFSAHKLIALGTLVFLALTVYRAHQASPLASFLLILAGFSILCFAITIITGGLISIEPPLPAFLGAIHRIGPYLTVLSSAACLYLILSVERG